MRLKIYESHIEKAIVDVEVHGVSKRRKGYEGRNVCLDVDVRNILCDKNEAWLVWLSKKGNKIL